MIITKQRQRQKMVRNEFINSCYLYKNLHSGFSTVFAGVGIHLKIDTPFYKQLVIPQRLNIEQ